jgi:peptidoglycan hydrolase-like protein with peptidoglycan-binding domain
MINKTKTFISVGIMFALVMAFTVSVQSASAYTVENITAGPSLTIGSTGTNVVVLQGLLSELGYLNIPVTTNQGYFGPATQAALVRYQVALNVTPAVGYFGPLSKVAMHAHFGQHNWLNILGW